MKKSKPNIITLGAVCAHTHIVSRGYLEYNKIVKENIKTQELYSVFVVNKNT